MAQKKSEVPTKFVGPLSCCQLYVCLVSLSLRGSQVTEGVLALLMVGKCDVYGLQVFIITFDDVITRCFPVDTRDVAWNGADVYGNFFVDVILERREND